MKKSRLYVLISCEHGGNLIPAAYGLWFKNRRKLLASHAAYDIGALAIAKNLSDRLALPLVYSRTSRLLIDMNRSLRHRHLFSEVTNKFSSAQKNGIIKQYWCPYRSRVQKMIDDGIVAARHVLHLSIHSFTPQLHNRVRNADIGLLYDPSRPVERSLARFLQTRLKLCTDYRIRLNYPYLGRTDGLTTANRMIYKPDRYSGIEIEINQKWLREGSDHARSISSGIIDAVKALIDEY